MINSDVVYKGESPDPILSHPLGSKLNSIIGCRMPNGQKHRIKKQMPPMWFKFEPNHSIRGSLLVEVTGIAEVAKST